MILNLENILKNPEVWKSKGIDIPEFDILKLRENTLKRPKWVHIGPGNIFRGFIARIQQNLIKKGLEDSGIIAVDFFDEEVPEFYKKFDNLTIAVTINNDGDFTKEIIASVVETLNGNPEFKDWEKLIDLVKKDSLQLISLTITEKGYNLTDQSDNFYSFVLEDFNKGPDKPKSTMGKITSLLFERYKSNKKPISLLSLDNFSKNGEKLLSSILTIAEKWFEKNFVDKNFIDYLHENVSFPLSMIDKIVPSPSEVIKNELIKIGIENIEIHVTNKKTYLAPFVNMENSQYLVIEDNFKNSRPLFENGGKNIFLTNKETVIKSEKMKVSACLNPLHTALAVYGCLLDYKKIADEMEDELLKKLVIGIGEEGVKVVEDPGIINPREFLNEVINVRLPNKYIPDTPQRIATDTSQKIPIRFGETIKAYYESKELDPEKLKYTPIAIAGWLRYLMGINDNGNPFIPSPDPLLKKLQDNLKNIKFGVLSSVKNNLKPILSNKELFKVNLYETNLGIRIENLFKFMIRGKHAIRQTLKEQLEKR